MQKIIVIGGGAAGLTAGIVAARRGMQVLILEKMAMPARKLRITGKGRCNLTNIAPQSEFLKKIGPDAKFLKYAFAKFFAPQLVEFLQEGGIEVITEQGGRVFPKSEKAQDVVDALISLARREGVEIRCNTEVREVNTLNAQVSGVTLSSGEIIPATQVILSAGGSSYPATGSTGDGYRIARKLGHTVIPVRPALVPVNTEGELAPKMQGISLKNVQINVWMDGKKQGEAFGEMMFTHFGLTGPIILTLSRRFSQELYEGKKLEFSLDLKPALDHEKLDARLLRDLDEHGKRSFQSLLKLLMPSGMVPVYCELSGIMPDKPANQISAAERKKLRLLLKDLRFKVTGSRGFKEAIITAGGVSTKEIDPVTMKSKLIQGLSFCGEVIDLDADTGGYNLQIAFSTAWVAGNSL
jgi:predicted Rossmann fold flavoprotein